MKKIVVVMNTDRVGGAERSILLQLVNQQSHRYHFLIPKVSGSHELEVLIKAHGFTQVTYYEYPKNLYTLSRHSSKASFALVWGAIEILFNKEVKEIIQTADIVYLNGMKAAFYFFLKNYSMKFRQKVVWHFRDYWHKSSLNDFIWGNLIKYSADKLHIVCNSNSTLQSLDQSPFKNIEKTVIYNPSGLPPKFNKKKNIRTIGFVSMLAPWKGIHQIVLWAKMYEAELMKLGIEKVNFYGTDLYATHGAHRGYAKQLQKLVTKLNPKLVDFKGQCEPEEIFSEIDCLIHYSLEAEPFGRVLIEAFQNGVPSISTCMGGASELIVEKTTGMSAIKYDLNGLMQSISQIANDDYFRSELIENAMKRSAEIEETIQLQMNLILEEPRAG